MLSRLIRPDALLGKAVRWPLRHLSADAQVRILRGPAKGMRWVAGSGPHSYWLADYEGPKTRAFAEAIEWNDVVVDIGAHAGYFTLVAARTAKEVYAFEPLPSNLSYLRRNVALNNLSNVQVIEAAVSDADGTAFFEEGTTSSRGHLGDQGHPVRTLSLDSAVSQGKLPVPTIMKIDVEGAELSLLRGAERLLREHHPTLFLATHGPVLYRECMAFLERCGYRTRLLAHDELLAVH